MHCLNKTIDMSLEKQHAEIWNYLNEIKVGMLTTSTDNFMHSRPMYLVQEHYEGIIWLFADKEGYKISEIKNNPHVNLNFVSLDDGHFLALSGIATLHEGGPQFNELWSDSVKVWFADSENPKENAVLIKIEIKQAEVWDTSKGMLKKAFEYAKARMTNSKPDLGENKVLAQ
jgi:general stress protein 26